MEESVVDEKPDADRPLSVIARDYASRGPDQKIDERPRAQRLPSTSAFHQPTTSCAVAPSSPTQPIVLLDAAGHEKDYPDGPAFFAREEEFPKIVARNGANPFKAILRLDPTGFSHGGIDGDWHRQRERGEGNMSQKRRKEIGIGAYNMHTYEVTKPELNLLFFKNGMLSALMWTCLLMQQIRKQPGGDEVLANVDSWRENSDQTMLWALVEALSEQDTFGGERVSFGIDTLVSKFLKRVVDAVRAHEARLPGLRIPVKDAWSDDKFRQLDGLDEPGAAARYVASLDGMFNKRNVGTEYILFRPEDAFGSLPDAPGRHDVERCSWMDDFFNPVDKEALQAEKGLVKTKRVYHKGLLFTVPESTPTRIETLPSGQKREILDRESVESAVDSVDSSLLSQ